MNSDRGSWAISESRNHNPGATERIMSEFRVDMDVEDISTVTVNAPFEVATEEDRSFIRVDFHEEVVFTLIKAGDSFFAGSDGHQRRGTILSVSAGGALIETDELAPEGAIVSMDFSVADGISLTGALGLVKRVEQTADGALLGVEFLSRERLSDLLSQPELEMLNDDFGYFASRLREMLETHIVKPQ